MYRFRLSHVLSFFLLISQIQQWKNRLGDIAWATSPGRHRLGDIAWATSPGRHRLMYRSRFILLPCNLADSTVATSPGRHRLGDIAWATSPGRHRLGDIAWA